MKQLTPTEKQSLLEILQHRFEENMSRHPKMKWSEIEYKLNANAEKLWSLSEMERTGGEPDVVLYNEKTKSYTFFDCSAQSPKERRSLCFDQAALDSRKQAKPKGSAEQLAQSMGTELLTSDQYHHLQTLGEFDTTTSSWVQTPKEIRDLGGALFGDRRYNTVFIYHNGAESYYAARGFRVSLTV